MRSRAQSYVLKTTVSYKYSIYHGVTARQKRVQSVGPSLGSSGSPAGPATVGAAVLPVGSGLICSPHTTRRCKLVPGGSHVISAAVGVLPATGPSTQVSSGLTTFLSNTRYEYTLFSYVM